MTATGNVLRRQARWLAVIGGSLVVTLWTVIRHITNGVNFDVVGQIGLVQQWSQGLHSGAQLGATNYVLKFPLYYAANHLSWLSPMNRLLLLALVCNLVTYWLLFLIFEKFLKLYDVRNRSWLYLAMVWLATIAGNVFWVDYANSRNLETVGGLAIVYLIARYLQRPKLEWLLAISLLGSIVFFADPLQGFICLAGLTIFGSVRLLFRRSQHCLLQTGGLLLASVGGFGLAKLLGLGVRRWLHVSFLTAPTSPLQLTKATGLASLHGLVTNSLRIFDADFLKRPYSVNSVREIMNALVLAVIVLFIVSLIARRQIKHFGFLVLSLITANYMLYVASGQVLQWQTSRYLVMVPLLTTGLVAVYGERVATSRKQFWQAGWLGVILISSLLLLGALAVSWPSRHNKDASIYATVAFMQQNGFTYGLGSREVGVTTTYFSGGQQTVLPMNCDSGHNLVPTNLFYDDAAFVGLYKYHGLVPIFFENGVIPAGKISCSQADVMDQFGQPNSQETVPGVGTVLVYQASRLQLPQITILAGQRPSAVNPSVNPSNSYEGVTSLSRMQGCERGTVDVLVAHPDDDILFMNPTLQKQLTTHCVRATYITAADDGRPTSYWQQREKGIQAAYAHMVGVENNWQTLDVQINGQHLVESQLIGHPAVTLLFLRLPDGNVRGEGFSATGQVSLAKLARYDIKTLTGLDGNAQYSYANLVGVVTALLKIDQPSAIYTHLLNGPQSQGDHSDHRAVGKIALLARTAAQSKAPVSLFVGYPSNFLPSNLSLAETAQKRLIFEAYATGDSTVCIFSTTCSVDDTYGRYFSRSYKIDMHQMSSSVKAAPRHYEPSVSDTTRDLLFH